MAPTMEISVWLGTPVSSYKRLFSELLFPLVFFTIVLRKVRTLFFRNFHIPVENGTEIKYRRSCIYRSVKNMGCYQKDEYLNGKPMIVDECICDTTECNRKMGVIETSSKSSETTTKGNNKKIISMQFCS